MLMQDVLSARTVVKECVPIQTVHSETPGAHLCSSQCHVHESLFESASPEAQRSNAQSPHANRLVSSWSCSLMSVIE